jgi:nitrous oxide reductase accessory protein NosL
MKKGLIVLIAALCLAVAAHAGEKPQGVMASGERCPVCGMVAAMYPDWNTEVRFSDGSRAVFDGPKDLFKYYLDTAKYNPSKGRGDVIGVIVRDYYSKAPIDALKAFFVIWSDVYGPMGHEPIPFEKEADARKFLKDHKGKKILGFNDITPKLIVSLDNP